MTHKLQCEARENDHTFFDFHYDGALICTTKLSHGSKYDIGDGLVSRMARQMCVSKRFFEEIVGCTKSRQDYIDRLIIDGNIPST